MMENVSSPSDVAPVGPQSCLPDLYAQYRMYALKIRAVAEDTVKQQLLYVRRMADYFGPPETVEALFRELQADSICDFLVEYAENYGRGSQRWMQFALRSFLRFAYLRSHTSQDLSRLIPSVRKRKKGHVPRVLPDRCISALRQGIERDSSAGLRDSAIVALLSTYGVRGVQIRRLRLDHIDWANGSIHFPAAKGSNAIEQPLTTEAGNRLADYIIRARPASSYAEVFLTLSEPGRPLCSSSRLSAILKQRMKQLGVVPPEGVSQGCHGFRHAFATRMTGKIPFKDVADLLGHRDPNSTLIYSKIDLNTLNEAALPWPGGES